MDVKNASFLTSAVDSAGYPPPDRKEIAIAGRSNVGKSTLINALVGRRALARISQKPGKTRLINFFDIDGKFHLVDLPGYGWAKVSKTERAKWEKIVETYLRRRETLACLVVLVDLRRGPGEMDFQLMDFMEAIGKPSLLVFTKADKLKGNQRRNQIAKIGKELGIDQKDLIVTSAVKRQGLKEVWESLTELL